MDNKQQNDQIIYESLNSNIYHTILFCLQEITVDHMFNHNKFKI